MITHSNTCKNLRILSPILETTIETWAGLIRRLMSWRTGPPPFWQTINAVSFVTSQLKAGKFFRAASNSSIHCYFPLTLLSSPLSRLLHSDSIDIIQCTLRTIFFSTPRATSKLSFTYSLPFPKPFPLPPPPSSPARPLSRTPCIPGAEYCPPPAGSEWIAARGPPRWWAPQRGPRTRRCGGWIRLTEEEVWG